MEQLRSAIEDVLFKTGKHSQDECSVLADTIINDIAPIPAAEQPQDADFEKEMEAEINKLPYIKHVDDGQYNDGQLAGFELGAEWARKHIKATPSGITWESCGKSFPDDWNEKVIRVKSSKKLIVESEVKEAGPEEFVMENGDVIEYWRCEWLNESSTAPSQGREVGRMLCCYLAHPISNDIEANLADIRRIVRKINLDHPDVVPFVPYYVDIVSLDDNNPAERARGIANDTAILRSGCVDEVWLTGGRISSGMQAEKELAEELNIPVIDMLGI